MISNISSSASSWANTLFSQLDTSNKGYLSESDLSTAFSSLTNTGSDSASSASKLFSSLDSNKDGKVTKDELASTLQSLTDQLNSQLDASRMAGAMGQGMPPPPPSGTGQDDSGLTQDQMTSIASTTSDSKLASLLSNVASNFSAADTDGDGKVTRSEAMAFQKSSENSTSSTSTSTGSGSATTSSNDQMITKRILELLQAYSSNLGSTSSTLSLSA